MRLSILFIFIFLVFISCEKSSFADKDEIFDKAIVKSADTTKSYYTSVASEKYIFYVGTYTSGESEGIYKYSLLEDGSIVKTGLAAATENPSFLKLSSDSRFLLAVNEKQTGTVESFSISEETELTFINRSSTGGKNPCYVSANDSGFVLVSNYGSGNVGLLKINEAGELSELLDTDQHSSEEYSNPHAHSAQFELTGNGIISADLGINELWFSKLNSEQQKMEPAEQQSLLMPEGSGPRHFVIHPNGKWIYVVNEYGNTVTLVNKNNEGQFSVVGSVSTLPEDFTGTSYCADIHISADNKFIYASNRGHNSIAIFNVAGDGSLSTVGFESTRGSFPRNFAISPDDNFLLAANQKSNNIVSFRRDATTGLLEFIGETEASIPTCILFYKPVTTSINEYRL
jgi:6-phosphogluconolactonase